MGGLEREREIMKEKGREEKWEHGWGGKQNCRDRKRNKRGATY